MQLGGQGNTYVEAAIVFADPMFAQRRIKFAMVSMSRDGAVAGAVQEPEFEPVLTKLGAAICEGEPRFVAFSCGPIFGGVLSHLRDKSAIDANVAAWCPKVVSMPGCGTSEIRCRSHYIVCVGYVKALTYTVIN